MHDLPAIVTVLTKDRKNERYQGVVVKANETTAHVVETCDHHHKYEDMAMTCARRMRQRRGWWD